MALSIVLIERREPSAVLKTTPKPTTHSDCLQDDDIIDSLFHPKPPSPKPNPLTTIRTIHHQIFNKILPTSPFWSAATTPLPDTQTPPINAPSPPHPLPTPKLSRDDIAKYLTTFHTSNSSFPFISLPPSLALEDVMKNHPVLLLGILAAMSIPNPPIHRRLDKKFRQVLAEKVVERDEGGLDLLQGLLVWVAWYPVHLNPKSLGIFKFMQMAVGLVVDLGIDKPPDAETRSREERLVYLGAYYLSTSVSLPFGRANNLLFTEYTESLLATPPIDETEERAYVLVKSKRIAEKAVALIRCGVETGLEEKIEELITDLDELQAGLGMEMAGDATILLTLDATRQKIYSTPLPLPKSGIILSPTPEFPILLSNCLSAVITAMTYLAALPVTAFTIFTLAEWNHVIDTIVTLSRLCFPIPTVPAWDAASARQTAGFVQLVTGLLGKMDELVGFLGSNSEARGKGRSMKENESSRLSIPGLFSAVLTSVLQQYEDRVVQEEQLAFFDNFDPNDQIAPATIADPLKTFQCPVMNGCLKGTEYAGAMAAFRTEVSADAWMGVPDYGSELFETAVLDDWYLWGMKLPEWNGGGG